MTHHPVSDPSVVWHGGIGHRLLGIDSGVECYRCGMTADSDALQELIPDCAGPESGHRHYWHRDMLASNACVWCGTVVDTETDFDTIPRCREDA